MKASVLASMATLSLAVSAICFAAESPEPQVRTLSYVVERTLTLEPSGPSDEVEPESTAWTAHLTMNARSLPHGGDGRVVTRFASGSKLEGPYLRVAETDEEWLEVDHEGESVYVSRLGLTRPHPANLAAIAEHGNLPPGSEVANRWWGVPIDYEPDDLVDIPPQHCLDPQPPASDYSEGGRLMLRAEAAEALVAMLDEMAAAEISVYVSSAYRSGATQRRIYLSATRRRMNQRGTAPPGHSEHQLGTTVDLSSEKESRRSLRRLDQAHRWMSANAARFGWHQSYRADNRDETGYIEEAWHWRYLGPPEPQS